MDFVQLTICGNAFEATLLKGKLETAGIPCVLQGGSISSVVVGSGGTSSAFAVPILVRTEDLPSAKSLLTE
ncbi:MAG: DUF2007 domain-containing protein [Bacteroidales bacterium]|nr:DUF2007 domain-containing protein [Bacteroidales bacterium]